MYVVLTVGTNPFNTPNEYVYVDTLRVYKPHNK